MSAQRDAFDQAIAAWNAGDLDAYLELYDDRIALHGYSEEPMGKPDVRGFYEGLFEALSDIVLEIDDVVESGVLLGCAFTMHGTHTGELAGIAADRTAHRAARRHDPSIRRRPGRRAPLGGRLRHRRGPAHR